MLTKEEKKAYQKDYMRRKRSNSGSNIEDGSNKVVTSDGSNTVDGSNTRSNIVWERGGYRGEYIDGVFCVNGKPYVIGDILDLQHAPYSMIARLYAMKA